MHLYFILSILVFPSFLIAQSEDCHCRKPEFEIGIGPQFVIPVITEYEVGISSNNKPEEEAKIAYHFHVSIRTHPAKFQAGLELIQDLKRFNIYLPLYWPSQEESQWNNYYSSYRLGLGAHLRFNFGSFFIQGGAAAMNEFSYSSLVEIEEPGAPGHELNETYSSKSGLLLNAGIGIKGENSRFSTDLSFGYDTAVHEFDNEIYAQHWKVRVNLVRLSINYRLNNPDQ